MNVMLSSSTISHCIRLLATVVLLCAVTVHCSQYNTCSSGRSPCSTVVCKDTASIAAGQTVAGDWGCVAGAGVRLDSLDMQLYSEDGSEVAVVASGTSKNYASFTTTSCGGFTVQPTSELTLKVKVTCNNWFYPCPVRYIVDPTCYKSTANPSAGVQVSSSGTSTGVKAGAGAGIAVALFGAGAYIINKWCNSRRDKREQQAREKAAAERQRQGQGQGQGERSGSQEQLAQVELQVSPDQPPPSPYVSSSMSSLPQVHQQYTHTPIYPHQQQQQPPQQGFYVVQQQHHPVPNSSSMV